MRTLAPGPAQDTLHRVPAVPSTSTSHPVPGWGACCVPARTVTPPACPAVPAPSQPWDTTLSLVVVVPGAAWAAAAVAPCPPVRHVVKQCPLPHPSVPTPGAGAVPKGRVSALRRSWVWVQSVAMSSTRRARAFKASCARLLSRSEAAVAEAVTAGLMHPSSCFCTPSRSPCTRTHACYRGMHHFCVCAPRGQWHAGEGEGMWCGVLWCGKGVVEREEVSLCSSGCETAPVSHLDAVQLMGEGRALGNGRVGLGLSTQRNMQRRSGLQLELEWRGG